MGCPIRKFSDQSLFAAPQDLSQRTTSFIASQRQGIRRIPFWHLIVLEIRKRTVSFPLAGEPNHERHASADVPLSRFPIRKDQFCFKHIREPAVRRGSRLVCYRTTNKQRDCEPDSRPILSPHLFRRRNRMRFLFTMSWNESRRVNLARHPSRRLHLPSPLRKSPDPAEPYSPRVVIAIFKLMYFIGNGRFRPPR